MRRLSVARIGAAFLIAVAAASAVIFGSHGSSNGGRIPVAALPSQGSATGEEGELRARDEWFYGQRAYPGIEIPAGAYGAARSQAQRIARETPSSPATGTAVASLTWDELGPHPITTVYSGTYTY